MLTPADDFPLHQSALPIAHMATGDLNHYDRYFFNGFSADGEVFFALALGLYPNRGVIDGALSVVHRGVQRSVWATGPAPIDRFDTAVGPIRVVVEEPMRTLRLEVDAPDHGLVASLTFAARSPAVEEPRALFSRGGRVGADFTRLTQWGRWDGELTVDSERIRCRADEVFGIRDRSWGVRGVGATGEPSDQQTAYWVWAPVHFDDQCAHAAIIDDPLGRHVFESAMRVPDLERAPAAYGEDTGVEHMRSVDHEITWVPGTRWAQSAQLTMRSWSGDDLTMQLEPVNRFFMRGLGYHHPRWGHGVDHGESKVEFDSWRVSDADPRRADFGHVQLVCKVTAGDRQGVGVLEHRVWGPHRPSGFVDFMGGAEA